MLGYCRVGDAYMVREVTKYGNPVLRRKGELIKEVTPEIVALANDMIETMRKADGVGLAAQQVGEALQMCVIDVSVSERPSWMEVGGKAVDVADYSPLVLINPIVTAVAEKGTEFGSEGCLSFPQIFAEVKRPAVVDVVATNEKNEKIEFRCGGLLARCVQHECDHLQGVMFIDRMEYLDREENDEALRKLRTRTKERLKRKKY